MRPPSQSDNPGWRQSRIGFAAFHGLALVGVYSLLRLGLFMGFGPASASVPSGDAVLTFLIGMHLDLLVALTMGVGLFSWLLVVPKRLQGFLISGGILLFWGVQTFLLAAEFFFFEEFRSRFNTVAVDYLLYPHEVFINIWDSYPVGLVVFGCAAVAFGWLWVSKRIFGPMWSVVVPFRTRSVHWLGAVLLWILAFSTVQLKETRFSTERVLNELANNGPVAFSTAVWTHHLDLSAFYRTMPLDAARERTRHLLTEPGVEFVGGPDSIRRQVSGDSTRPRLNVVLFLEESFGSEFWGSLGRKEETLTPEMDRLAAEEGMLFSNIYASGNRTVRGLEGVLASFPPLPGDSIVKRDLSDNVETIARVLKRDGYSTVFLYGGRGIFDGMRSFAVNNGYDRFIEQKDFEKPTFSTIWGVCDEDLYDRTIDELRVLSKQEEPFFATVLSVSNHKPYTYPKERIAEDPDKRRRAFAVKYTDYSLGRFFRQVKNESFYQNTLFLVVADHGARVYGSQSIPIHSYEIPWLIVGPAFVKAPSRVDTLGCSLDVAPTLLGILGRPYETLFFGRDLLKNPGAGGRVLLNHNRDIGLYESEKLVVLGLNKTAEHYSGDPKSAEMSPQLQPGDADLETEKNATALFQVADDLYVHKRYRLDK